MASNMCQKSAKRFLQESDDTSSADDKQHPINKFFSASTAKTKTNIIQTSDLIPEEAYLFLKARLTKPEGTTFQELKGATVVKCLQECLQFSVGRTFSDNEVSDSVTSCSRNPSLKWLCDNFALNLKESPDENIVSLLRESVRRSSELGDRFLTGHALVFQDYLSEMYMFLKNTKYDDDDRNLPSDIRYEKVKPFLSHMIGVLGVPFRQHGEAQFRVTVNREMIKPFQPKELSSDICDVELAARPDFIFRSPTTFMEAIPVQVYGSHKDQSPAETFAEQCEILRKEIRSSSDTDSSGLATADTNINLRDEKFKSSEILYEGNLQAELRSCIRRCLPVMPEQKVLTSHCLKKMAGQHIAELIALGQFLYSSEHFKDDGTDPPLLGLFVYNEYVFLSKLKTSAKYYSKLSQSKREFAMLLKWHDMVSYNGEAVCTFSNWCLDMTVYNHRMALLYFLQLYLYPEMGE